MTYDAREFQELVRTMRAGRTMVLTGAGCSTDSGIPDYRGPGTRNRARNPITFQQYTRDDHTRRRYWARSAVGWPKIRDAEPNATHHALARLQGAGFVDSLVTQNVDRLHTKAGSEGAIELHGALADVICLECGAWECRDEVQARIVASNPHIDGSGARLAPDGDADIEVDFERFEVPWCVECGGALKPDVVFFGENVPSSVVAASWDVYDRADSLLVVGSSLTVYSGRRFVMRAQKDHKPVAIINLGPTRSDEAAWIRLDCGAGAALDALVAELC